jgi:hypothetical protein
MKLMKILKKIYFSRMRHPQETYYLQPLGEDSKKSTALQMSTVEE